MKSFEQVHDKPLECPISHKGRSKFIVWMKRLGVIGFMFFLLKGLIWLVIFTFGIEFFKNLF